MSNESILEIME